MSGHEAMTQFCAVCKMDRRHVNGECVECRMSDAHDRAGRAREALKATAEGAKWYASRDDAHLVLEIRDLVVAYHRATRESFFEMAAFEGLPVFRDIP